MEMLRFKLVQVHPWEEPKSMMRGGADHAIWQKNMSKMRETPFGIIINKCPSQSWKGFVAHSPTEGCTTLPSSNPFLQGSRLLGFQNCIKIHLMVSQTLASLIRSLDFWVSKPGGFVDPKQPFGSVLSLFLSDLFDRCLIIHLISVTSIITFRRLVR